MDSPRGLLDSPRGLLDSPKEEHDDTEPIQLQLHPQLLIEEDPKILNKREPAVVGAETQQLLEKKTDSRILHQTEELGQYT